MRDVKALLLGTCLFLVSVGAISAPVVQDIASAQVFFSPENSGQKAIYEQIANAKTSIKVAAFHFSKNPIADALLKAHHRGVEVAVVLDHSHLYKDRSKPSNRKPSATLKFLSANGIKVSVDTQHRTMHNKHLVIDGQVVISGSYNFNDKAERKNAENLLVIHSKSLAQQYEANWQIHNAHSQPFNQY